MIKVHENLYVGDDSDFERLHERSGWSFLRCCKFGPGSHKELLGYETQAAPEGKNQFVVRKGNIMALNLLDLHDPNFVPTEAIQTGLDFIQKELAAGNKVLVACNHGVSRGPTVALMFMRTLGEFPYGFMQSERIFRGIYHPYNPGIGINQFARQQWAFLGNTGKVQNG